MYQLYIDKENIFNCNVEIEGASISNTKSRLILQGSNGNFLFEGAINEHGECEIPINGLKGFFKKNDTGNILLEVIVEDTVFNPWESIFQVCVTKEVTISEVKSTEKRKPQKPKVKVTINEDFNYEAHLDTLLLLEKRIKNKKIKTTKTKLFESYVGQKMQEASSIQIDKLKTQYLK